MGTRRSIVHPPLGGQVKTRSHFWQGLFIILGLAALWWALRDVPLIAVWDTLRSLNPAALLLLLALNALILVLFGLRGWLLGRALGLSLPLWAQVGYRLAAFSVSYFTPGTQIGGEPLHMRLLQKRHGWSTNQALTVIGVDKALEMSINFAFLVLGLGWALHTGWATLSSWWLVLPFSLAALPLLWLLALRWGWRTPWPWKWLQQAERLTASLPRRALWQGVWVSLLTWFFLIGEYALMLRALGAPLSLAEVVLALTAARLAFLTPSPGGLGALEAGQVWALTRLGYPPALGLSLGLLIRGRDIFFGLLGLLLAARWLREV